MEPRAYIWALPGGTKALLSILSADVTEEDIETQLALKGVVAGIDKGAIRQAIAAAHSFGDLQTNIVVAQAEIARPTILLGNEHFELTTAHLRDIRDRFQAVSIVIDAIKDGGKKSNAPDGLFVMQNQVFCIEDPGQSGSDIFGRPVEIPRSSAPALQCDATISPVRKDNRIEYSAEKSGYLAAAPSGVFGIVDATGVSSNKMELFFVILPVRYQVEALSKFFYQTILLKCPKAQLAPIDDPDSLFSPGKAYRHSIRSGMPMVPGWDAQLILHAKTQPPIIENEDGTFDIRETSMLNQVQEGAFIAEIIPAIDGVPGENVFGEAIPAKPPKTVSFKAGRNILERQENGRIVYQAGCTGVLKVTGAGAEIVDVLHIAGDVGPDTGNIRSDKDVAITGNIISGYKVHCGGDLILSGGIENGAIIICKQNAIIRKGVFGEKTSVTIQGDADIGFIQEAKVCVEGDLRVRKYIYNAHVFCNRRLTVDGIGVEGNARGCILGGEIVAMVSMALASAGCEGETTKLCCGVNPEALAAAVLIKSKISSLNKKATSLRSAMKIDLNSPNVQEKLMALPDKEKARIKALLSELKVISQEQGSFAAKLPPLEKMALSERPESCGIAIKKFIVPQVVIRIGKETRIEHERKIGGVYKFIEGSGIELKGAFG